MVNVCRKKYKFSIYRKVIHVINFYLAIYNHHLIHFYFLLFVPFFSQSVYLVKLALGVSISLTDNKLTTQSVRTVIRGRKIK